MRLSVLLILLLIFSLPVQAEDDDFLMPILPDAPILLSDWAIYYAQTYQFAWLDNETLVFTPYDRWYSLPEDSPYETYSYDLSENSLQLLDESLFRENWGSEWREYYQVGDNTVFRSPYSAREESESVPLVYESSLFVRCGTECGDSFIMLGSYSIHPNDLLRGVRGWHHPLDILAYGDILINWSPSNQELVMQMEVPYGQGKSLYYLDLQNVTETHISYGLFDFPNDQVFAFSPSGRRLVLASHHRFDDASDSDQEWWQKLIIWEAPPEDPNCNCMYHEGTAQAIYSPTNQEAHRRRNYVGASFVDEETILYIGNEGLFQHNLRTGESTLLNPEFNSHWINLAIFSPDNQHIAVTTEQGLYVLETGFSHP